MNIAKASPRFEEDGTLCFYKGDTFSITFNLELSEDGVPIAITPEDEVVVAFKISANDRVPIKTFSFKNISDNKITVEFDRDTALIFDTGTYCFGIKYVGNGRTATLVPINNILVEVAI